MLRTQVKRP